MRIAFTAASQWGHTAHLLPSAQLLQQQGHDVAVFYYDGPFGQRIRDAGLHVVSLGADDGVASCGAGLETWLANESARQAVKVFTGYQAHMHSRLLEALTSEYGAAGPDLLVADMFTLAAAEVAELQGMPLALLGTIPLSLALDSLGAHAYNLPAHVPVETMVACLPSRMSTLERWLLNPLAKWLTWRVLGPPVLAARNTVRQRLGLPALPGDCGFAQPRVAPGRMLTIVGTCWLLETERPLPPDWHLVGSLGTDFKQPPPALQDGRLRTLLDDAQGSKRPVVLVATGTIVALQQQQVQELAAAFASLPHVQFVWSLKEEVQQQHLPPGSAPDNVLVLSWVPQTAVLCHPAVRVFVTHAGRNSINEGLAAGKPLLCIPVFGDQPVNAQAVENGGFGLQVHPNRLQRVQLAASITRLLDAPQYAAAAAAAGEQMRQQPGPAGAARLLADFAARCKAAAGGAYGGGGLSG